MTKATLCDFSKSESGNCHRRGSLTRQSPYVAAFVVALTLVSVTAPTTSVSASLESPSTSTEEVSTAFQPSRDATSGLEVRLSSVKTDTSHGALEIFSSSLSGATSSSARNPAAISNTHEITTNESFDTQSLTDLSAITTDTEYTSSASRLSTTGLSSIDDVFSKASQPNPEASSTSGIGDTSVTTDSSYSPSSAISSTFLKTTSPGIMNHDSNQSTTPFYAITNVITRSEIFTSQSLTDLVAVTTEIEDTTSVSGFPTSGRNSTEAVRSSAHQEITSTSIAGDSSATAGASMSASEAIHSTLLEANSPATAKPGSEQTSTSARENTEKDTSGKFFTALSSIDLTSFTVETENMSSASSMSTRDPDSTGEVQSTAWQTHQEVTSASEISDRSVKIDASSSSSDVITNAISDATSPAITDPDPKEATTPVSGNTEESATGEFSTTRSSTDHTNLITGAEETSTQSILSTSNHSSADDVHSTASRTHPEDTSGSGVDNNFVTTDTTPIASDAISTASSEATLPAATSTDLELTTTHAIGNTERDTTGKLFTTPSSTDHTVVATDAKDTLSASSLFTSDPSNTDKAQNTASQTQQEVTSAPEISDRSVTTDVISSTSNDIASKHTEATAPAITNPYSQQTTTPVSSNTSESTRGEFFTTRSSTGHISFTADTEDLSTSSLFTSDFSSTNDIHSIASQSHPEVTSKSGFDDTSVKTDASPSSSDAIFTVSSDATSPAITNPDSEQSTSPVSGSTQKSATDEFLTTQSLTDHTAVTTEEKYTSSTPSMSTSGHNSTDDVHSTTSQPHLERTSGSGVDDTSVTTDSSQSASKTISSTPTDATSPAVTNPDSVLSTTSFSANTDHFNTDDFATTQSLSDITVFTSDKEVTSSVLLLSTTDLISTDYVYSTASQPHQEITSGSRVSDSSVTTDASSGFSDAILTASSEATSPAVTNPDLEPTTTHASGNTAVSTTGEFVITQSSTDHAAVITTNTEDTSPASSLSTSDPSSTSNVQSTVSHTHQEVTSASEISHTPVTTDASPSSSDAVSNTLSKATSPAITFPDSEGSTAPSTVNLEETTTGKFVTNQSSADLTVVTLDKEDTSSVSSFFTSDPGSTHKIYSTASQADPEITSSSEVGNTSVITPNATQRDFISSTLSEATSDVITIPDSEKSTAVSKHTDSITVEESFTTQSSSGHTAETGNRSPVSGFSTSDLNSTDDVLSTTSPPHPEVTSGTEVGGSSVTTHGRENATDALLSTHSDEMSSAATKPDFLQSTANAITSTYDITTVHSVSSSFHDNASIDWNTTPVEPMKYKVEGNVTFSLNYSLLTLESTREAFQEAVISTIRFISQATNGTIVEILDIKAGSIIVDFRLESTSSLQAAQKNLKDAKAENFKNHLVIEARKSKSLDDIFEYIATMDPPKINILENHASSPTGPNSAIENWLIAVIIIASIVPLAAIIVVIRCVRKRGAKQPSERDEERRRRQPAFAGGSRRNTMDYEMESGGRNVTYYTKASGNRNAMDSEVVRVPKGRNYGTRRDSLESESSRGPGDLRPPIGAAAIDKPRRSADYDYHSERPRGRLDYQDESRPPTERLMQRSSPYTGDYPWRDALADLVAAGRSASFDSRRSVAENARYAGGPWRPNSDTRENTSVRQYQPMTSFPRQLITFGQNQESGFPRESSRAFPRLVRTRSWSRPAADYEG